MHWEVKKIALLSHLVYWNCLVLNLQYLQGVPVLGMLGWSYRFLHLFPFCQELQSCAASCPVFSFVTMWRHFQYLLLRNRRPSHFLWWPWFWIYLFWNIKSLEDINLFLFPHSHTHIFYFHFIFLPCITLLFHLHSKTLSGSNSLLNE